MPSALINRLLWIATASTALSACGPASLLNALAPNSTYELTTGLSYGHQARQKLDVYVPARRTQRGDDTPVVVFFYGGSWQNGERDEYRFVGEALASRGFLVVIPDYRTYPSVVFPTFVEDAARAVRWARDHAKAYGGDANRLILMGHSAGAQMVTLLATDTRYLDAVHVKQQEIAAVVGLAGPYDFLPLQSKVLEQIFPAAIRDQSQPIRYVTGREPPMWLGVGESDSLVDPGNTERFARRLREMGDEVHVQRYDLGHLLLLGAFGVPVRTFSTVLDDVATYINSVPARASGRTDGT